MVNEECKTLEKDLHKKIKELDSHIYAAKECLTPITIPCSYYVGLVLGEVLVSDQLGKTTF